MTSSRVNVKNRRKGRRRHPHDFHVAVAPVISMLDSWRKCVTSCRTRSVIAFAGAIVFATITAIDWLHDVEWNSKADWASLYVCSSINRTFRRNGSYTVKYAMKYFARVSLFRLESLVQGSLKISVNQYVDTVKHLQSSLRLRKLFKLM